MNEKKILATAVKAAGEHSKAKVLWVIQPLLEQMAMAFAGYVGMEALDSGGRPLLVTAVKNAIGAFNAHGDDEQAARAAFVRSLLDNCQDVFSQLVVVETQRGAIAWTPFASGLTDFLALHEGGRVEVSRQPCRIPEQIARTFLMTKIIPSTLLDQDSLAELFNDAPMAV